MAVVLVVDDDPQVRALLASALRQDGHTVHASASGHEALRVARLARPHICLIDRRLPDLDGLAVFSALRQELPLIVGVMITGSGSVEHATQSFKAGIADYIEKPFQLHGLLAVVNGLLAVHGHESVADDDGFDGMIGNSLIMQEVYSRILAIAPLDLPVLILGETGTGKELVARSLHRRSLRAQGPFVDVNCPAIAPTLFESELFGHERGAFTDARDSRPGYFERAQGGTLFLDEIGDLAREGQAKLLRVTEQRAITRVGGRNVIPTDVRLVAATNIDLAEAAAHGQFRADLFHRLAALTITVPPMRERGADVQRLLEYFLQRTRRELHRPRAFLSTQARARLLSYSWPGNAREMAHVCRHAVLQAATDAIDLGHFERMLSHTHAALPQTMSVQLREGQSLAQATAQFEAAGIEQALREATGHRGRAAARLGVTERTLYNKMRQYGLLARSSK